MTHTISVRTKSTKVVSPVEHSNEHIFMDAFGWTRREGEWDVDMYNYRWTEEPKLL